MALKQEIPTRPTVEILLLGGFDVHINGQPLPPLRTRKVQWLLSLLALRLGHEIRREYLAETLWPDSEAPKALFNLRQELSGLRRVLGSAAPVLRAPTPHTLTLDPAGVWTDVVAFDNAIQQKEEGGRKKDEPNPIPPSSLLLPPLEAAVALYRGPLLPDCLEEWVLSEREARQLAYLSALETLASQALQEGQPAVAVRWLRLAVAADPYRESAHCALMQALADCGDQAAMTQVYRDLRLMLRRELNVDPAPETDALYRSLRERATQPRVLPSASTAPSGPPRRLPVPLSDLIGREPEIEEVGGWLGRNRLVTLIGTGGVGKTRLSIAVAERVIEQFPGGVWFVDLAPLRDPTLITQTFLRSLDIPEEPNRTLEATLEQSVASRTLLLVLDNCEHLLEACASQTHRLLSACPGLKVLATSRETLGLTGEHLYRVPSLALPLAGEVNVEKVPSSLLEYAAVQLFVERARQANSSFHLSRNNAELVRQICQCLDGIPLALEMAAARLKSLSVGQIAARLEDRFHLLTGGSRAALPRQRTLRATLDWSYDLLTEEERLLLRRLSVFVGGWRLEAAEAVCSDECGGMQSDECRMMSDESTTQTHHSSLIIHHSDVLDLLTSLVDKSLVVYAPGEEGGGRYRLLETMRQYAAERLAKHEETEAARDRHRDYFLARVEEINPKLSGPEQAHWLDVLEEEHDNLRAALTCCQEQTEGGEKGLRLGRALGQFWWTRGHLSEARKQLKVLLSHPEVQGRSKTRADALTVIGVLARSQGDYTSASALHEESLVIRRELGDRRGIANELGNLGNLAWNQGDYASARVLHEECLEIQRELGIELGIATSLCNLGLLAVDQGDYASARALYEESLGMQRALGNREGIANLVSNLGHVAFGQGDYALAQALYEEALLINREIGHRPRDASNLHSLGEVSFAQGDYASARALYEESLEILRELGDRRGIAESIEAFALLALKEESAGRAVRLCGAASALRMAIGLPLPPYALEEQERDLAAVREVMGEDAFLAAWEEGRSMTLKQAAAYALEDAYTHSDTDV